MKYRHNTTQDRPIVNATDDTSDTLLCAYTLAPPACTAADSPTANSGRGMMNAYRSIRGRWCSTVVAVPIAVGDCPRSIRRNNSLKIGVDTVK